MKLKLREINGISILEVVGEATQHHVNVLQAGLKNLFSSGKSRVILDISQTEKLSSELVEQIVKFQSLAAEHSSSIALVGKGDMIRTVAKKMEAAAVRYFPTIDAAIGSFESVEVEKRDPIAAYKDLSLEALKKLQADVQARNQILQNKANATGAGDLKKLQQENASLARQISVFTTRLAEMKKFQNTEPASSPAFQDKIVKAEAYLEDFLKKEGLLK